MYAVCVGGKTKKARLNLTIDPDLYREARRVFSALDFNMSAFVEMALAQLLNSMGPMLKLLEDPNVPDEQKKLAAYMFWHENMKIVEKEGAEFIQTINEKYPPKE